MKLLKTLGVAAVLASLVASTGCGLLRRNSNSANASNVVEINDQGRDLATLNRDEYEIVSTGVGEQKQVGVFILTIPVGPQTTKDEATSSAYFAAVDSEDECDMLIAPRVRVKRTLIPLLLVNIVIRKTRVKGRCAHLKAGHKGPAGSSSAAVSRAKPTPSVPPKTTG